MKKWRLIPFLEGYGKLQMAIDSWILKQHQEGKILPTLRFYTWNPIAISLGRNQHNYPEFWNSLMWKNSPINLVRRPTGGRGVLHQGDLTYMIVTSQFQGKRIEVYKSLCQFLIDGWKLLGYDLFYGKAGRGYIHHPSCFNTATSADLILKNGYKLIGSAQFIRQKNILQHGSMRLFPDVDLSLKVFPNTEAITPIFSEITDKKKFKETIINTLIESAKNCFNIDFIIEPFSEKEWHEILNISTFLP